MSHLLLWMWLAILGFLVTRRVLHTPDPWLTLGAAVPTSLVLLLATSFPLARLFGHPQGWVLAAVFLFVSTVALYVWRSRGPRAPELEEFGFSPFQWGAFMTLLSLGSLVMHTREALGPEDDYWVHFPLISLLNRGEFPPPNPFFEDLVLHGHFGRDYLVGVLGWFNGGGEALLSSLWVFNHVLAVSAFFLAFGLGRRVGGNCGGFLMSTFLFFGISVGARVGLMDTYDNNNLLVYVLLLLFVALETADTKNWWGHLFFGLALGVYGIVYETHMVLFLMVLWFGPLIWARGGQGWSWRLWLRPLGLSLMAVVVAACLGGPIQDLAMRGLGLRKATVDHAATYQAQRVQIRFPKENLFQIMIGPERYRRLSYVYQGKAFRSLHATGSGTGDARADFHYSFIFGPEVLLIHWLALYLGLPAGWFLLRKRHPQGAALWVFGLLAYLTPALVDFGPVHEREYFRWEFAAGFGFAGALACALSALWSRGKWARVLVVVLAILVTLGGERKLNKTLIAIEKMEPAQRQRAMTPWYPSARDWLLDSKELRMTPELLQAAQKLREFSRAQDRMVCDLDARAHWDIFRESTVCGLAGLRSVGHVSPPPWMQDGIAPFFRTAAWNALWQTGDLRILPSLGARWLLTHQPQSAEFLRADPESVKELASFGDVVVWRYVGELSEGPAQEVASARLVGLTLPPEEQLQGETALPVRLELEGLEPEKAFDLSVRWTPLPGTDPGGPIEDLVVRATAESSRTVISHHLVAPLVEGRYRLEFLLNGHPLKVEESLQPDLELQFDWSGQAAQARVVSQQDLSLVFEPGGEHLQPPLRLGLRLYRLDENRYSKPFGFEAQGVWTGEPEVVLERLDDGLVFPLPSGLRADIFLLDRSGREILLGR